MNSYKKNKKTFATASSLLNDAVKTAMSACVCDSTKQDSN